MSGNHNEQQQAPPHFQYPHEHGRGMYRTPLPSLAASAAAAAGAPPLSMTMPSLPMRLPQLSALAHAPPHTSSRSPQSSSAGSSPATSPTVPAAATSGTVSRVTGMKRPLRVDHLASATVHPSTMLLAATASMTVNPSTREVVKSEDEAAVPTTRKRRATDTNDDDDVFISGAYKAQRKPAPNATHELRGLRHDAAHMEYQIQALRTHWRAALPDDAVLLRACEAAKSKWITAQAEELNRQLKEQLLQQQLYLASLQNLVLQSPFFEHSRSKEVFDALHTPTQLDSTLSVRQRRDQLQAVCDLGVRMAPSVIARFVTPHAHRSSVEAPFAHASVMCDGAYTYASNVFACRVPHASLRDVADATRAYYTSLQREMKTHVGLDAHFRFIEQLSDASHYAQIRHENGPELTSVINATFAAHETADRAVFVTDFVDHDAEFPTTHCANSGDGGALLKRDTCHALVLTLASDAQSGQPHVLLQRVSVARYDLPPNSRLVHLDIKTTQQWFNGDLLLKVICQQLELQQQRRDE